MENQIDNEGKETGNRDSMETAPNDDDVIKIDVNKAEGKPLDETDQDGSDLDEFEEKMALLEEEKRFD